MSTPEQNARETIDRLLMQAEWVVCIADQAHITAYRGEVINDFPFKACKSYCLHSEY